MERADYYDLGHDTERWWREHIKGVMPHLRHTPRARGQDFRGAFEGSTVFIDVKFCRARYRQPGWIEVKSWGKITGIVQTAREYYGDPTASVFIAVLEAPSWHLIDVKELLREWEAGRLQLEAGTSTDDEGQTTPNWHWCMRGWEDERFRVISGPLREELWKPMTEIGKRMDMTQWMNGTWALRAGALKS